MKAHGIEEPCGQPLGKYLYDPTWVASAADGADWVKSRRNFIEEDGVPQWIADLGIKGLSLADGRGELGLPMAVSGNSVLTEFNPNPANPRLFTATGEELERLTRLWDSTWATEKYYDPELREVLKETLLSTVNERKLSMSEINTNKFSLAPASSNKQGLLTRIKR